jgi:hypothetical protein
MSSSSTDSHDKVPDNTKESSLKRKHNRGDNDLEDRNNIKRLQKSDVEGKIRLLQKIQNYHSITQPKD